MTKIALEISSCNECPFFKRERYYTSDSWEMAFNWYCTREKNEDGKDKEISTYVEWNDVKDIKIPEWCPIKIED